MTVDPDKPLVAVISRLVPQVRSLLLNDASIIFTLSSDNAGDEDACFVSRRSPAAWCPGASLLQQGSSAHATVSPS